MQPHTEPQSRPELLRRRERRPQTEEKQPVEQPRPEDPVERASRDSFPASDPPSWVSRRRR